MDTSKHLPEPEAFTLGVTALMERIEERRFGVAVLARLIQRGGELVLTAVHNTT